MGHASRRVQLIKKPVGEDVLIVRHDRRTGHLRITSPDDFELAIKMLKGAARALHEAELKRHPPLAVAAATPGEAHALGIKLD